MMRTAKLVFAALALVSVAGCKLNLTTHLYSSDLRDMMAGTTGITAPATMAFEIPSTKKCDEYTAKISEIVKGVLKEFIPKGCHDENFDSFLTADTQMPIFKMAATNQESKIDALFSIVLREQDDSESNIEITLLLDTQKYGVLLSRMKEAFSQTINLSKSKVKLVLHNDERNDLIFSVREAFLNSKPIHHKGRTYKLARRHKVTIQLSDVATTYLAKEGTARGFVLGKFVTN